MELPSASFADPLKLKPVHLSVGSVQWLSEELKIAPTSPMAVMLGAALEPSARTNRELETLGIPNRGSSGRPGGKGKNYRDALETLADPEAVLTVSDIPLQGAPLSMRVVLGSGRAVVADVDPSGLSFSPAVPYPDLLRALGNIFRNTAEIPPQNLTAYQAQYQVFSALVANFERAAVDSTITTATAAQRLAPMGAKPEEVPALLEELASVGFLESRLPHEAVVTPSAEFFLKRLSSNAYGELSLVIYEEDGSEGPPRVLRFAGLENDRITLLYPEGDDLKLIAPQAPPDAKVISFVTLNREGMQMTLEAFLGLTPLE